MKTLLDLGYLRTHDEGTEMILPTKEQYIELLTFVSNVSN